MRTLREHNVPLPLKQERIYDEEGFVARTDFLYPAQKLVVETHSRKHHSGPKAWDRDSPRRNRLAAMGYRTIEITYAQLKKNPAGVARQIAAALLS